MSCDSNFSANIIASRYDISSKFSEAGNKAIDKYGYDGWEIANNMEIRNERDIYTVYSYDTLLQGDFRGYEEKMNSVVIFQRQKENSKKWQCLALYRTIEAYPAGQVRGINVEYIVDKKLDQKNDPLNNDLLTILQFPPVTPNWTEMGAVKDIVKYYNGNQAKRISLMDPLNITFCWNQGGTPHNCWDYELDKYRKNWDGTSTNQNGCYNQFRLLTGVPLDLFDDNFYFINQISTGSGNTYYKSGEPTLGFKNLSSGSDTIDPNITDPNIQDPTNNPNNDPETAPINNGTTIGDLDTPPHLVGTVPYNNPIPSNLPNNTNSENNNNSGMSGTINFTPGTYTSDENAIDSINDYDSETSPVNTAPVYIIPSNNTKKNDSCCDSCEKGETCKDTKLKYNLDLVLLLGLGALLIYTASGNK